jgi:phytoene desaturase
MKNDAFLNGVDDDRAFDGTGRRAIVIGSGFGGLAAAIRLRLRGWRCTVLEKLDAPGGRAYVHRRTASPSTPARRSSPCRTCSRSCGAAGRRLADDVRPAPDAARSTASASTTARTSTTAATRRRCAPRWRASARTTWPGYDSFMREAEVCYQQRLRRDGTRPSTTFQRPAAGRAAAGAHARLAHDLADGLPAHAHPKLRIVFSFHPLLIGGNPFS